MQKFNILISSAAAKVLLVENFLVQQRTNKVFTCDVSVNCAAGLKSSRHFRVLPLNHAEALDQMLALCAQQEIKLVVPTRDGELSFYARHIEDFRKIGTTVLVPTLGNLERSQNKRLFTRELLDKGLPVIPLANSGSVKFPAFIRPTKGAAGVGARKINSKIELEQVENLDDYLLHDFIDAPEYSIDLLMDLTGTRSLQAVSRERIQVVAGESKISRVVENKLMCELACKLGEALGLVGHNTAQAFDHPKHGPIFIEVNPRFGGASNLSIQAGLASPERILALLDGDASAYEPRKIRFGATMYRYSNDIILDE